MVSGITPWTVVGLVISEDLSCSDTSGSLDMVQLADSADRHATLAGDGREGLTLCHLVETGGMCSCALALGRLS